MVWLVAPDADPFEVRQSLFAPSSVLWDGLTTFVLLEGDRVEIDAERRSLRGGWSECDAPTIPAGRRSMRPRDLRSLTADSNWLAEVGVGTVHGVSPDSGEVPANAELFADLKRAYDPVGRLNPGRQPW